MEIDKMSLREFKEKYMNAWASADNQWDFKLFKIQCEKCSSLNVEINGHAENEAGYYDEHYIDGKILVKCHDCGNAMVISFGHGRAVNIEHFKDKDNGEFTTY